jgi:hypothetical protein
LRRWAPLRLRNHPLLWNYLRPALLRHDRAAVELRPAGLRSLTGGDPFPDLLLTDQVGCGFITDLRAVLELLCPALLTVAGCFLILGETISVDFLVLLDPSSQVLEVCLVSGLEFLIALLDLTPVVLEALGCPQAIALPGGEIALVAFPYRASPSIMAVSQQLEPVAVVCQVAVPESSGRRA